MKTKQFFRMWGGVRMGGGRVQFYAMFGRAPTPKFNSGVKYGVEM